MATRRRPGSIPPSSLGSPTGSAISSRPDIRRLRILGIAVGLLAPLVLAAPFGLAPARIAVAATPSLTLVSDTTYDVAPEAGRVHVTSVVTASSHLTDTITKQYFFRTAYLTVLPNTTGFKVTSPGASPKVSVSARTSTYTILKLDFGKNLGSGRSIVLTLTFDIKDPGGAPDRPVRISPSIVSFAAWAFATPETSGGSVTVRFPAGYTVAIGRGPLSGPRPDASGLPTWTSGRLASPTSFIADITADRPGDDDSTSLHVAVGDASAVLELRSWPDDHAWRDRVGDLLLRGLPVLGADIGVPWPIDGDLVVQEALVRSTGGYAGLFDPASREVLISYTASSAVVLHEAAHAWFNGRLVADRWAAEAFASWYASTAAAQLKVPAASPALTDELRRSAIPLNAWGPIGSVGDDQEAYAYAASFAFAQAVAERAGKDALRTLWARAAAGAGAYQVATADEPAGRPPDWRNLLDLLEEGTGKDFSDLWRTWVARPEDLPLLDARATARIAYEKAVADAGSWVLPRSIRDAMRTWQFGLAMDQLAAAEAVLAQRANLSAAADAQGVRLPATLETVFSGDAGLAAAAAEASAELTTLESIRQAAAADPSLQPDSPAVLVAVGLLGEDPGAELAAARSAFAAGDLDGAIKAASAAAADWTSAADRGRGRLVSLGLTLLALLLVGRMLMLHRWRRRTGWTRD
jgi:hypothetical protein